RPPYHAAPRSAHAVQPRTRRREGYADVGAEDDGGRRRGQRQGSDPRHGRQAEDGHHDRAQPLDRHSIDAMKLSALGARVIVIGFALTAAALLTPPGAGAQAAPGIDDLLARVGSRIAEFYERAQRVICLETSTVQPIDRTYSSQGFARTVESELRVEA